MRISVLLLFSLLCFLGFGQSRSTENWIDFGSSHINKWLQIAPGKLGPNALPVPFMDYALLDSVSNIEAGFHAHYMKGDKGINSYLSLYWAVKHFVHIILFETTGKYIMTIPVLLHREAISG